MSNDYLRGIPALVTGVMTGTLLYSGNKFAWTPMGVAALVVAATTSYFRSLSFPTTCALIGGVSMGTFSFYVTYKKTNDLKESFWNALPAIASGVFAGAAFGWMGKAFSYLSKEMDKIEISGFTFVNGQYTPVFSYKKPGTAT